MFPNGFEKFFLRPKSYFVAGLITFSGKTEQKNLDSEIVILAKGLKSVRAEIDTKCQTVYRVPAFRDSYFIRPTAEPYYLVFSRSLFFVV